MTDNNVKFEDIKSLIKRGHHRRKPNMEITEIIIDSEDEDEFIDVETLDFDESKVPPPSKVFIKEEPSYDGMDSDVQRGSSDSSSSSSSHSDSSSSDSSTYDIMNIPSSVGITENTEPDVGVMDEEVKPVQSPFPSEGKLDIKEEFNAIHNQFESELDDISENSILKSAREKSTRRVIPRYKLPREKRGPSLKTATKELLIATKGHENVRKQSTRKVIPRSAAVPLTQESKKKVAHKSSRKTRKNLKLSLSTSDEDHADDQEPRKRLTRKKEPQEDSQMEFISAKKRKREETIIKEQVRKKRAEQSRDQTNVSRSTILMDDSSHLPLNLKEYREQQEEKQEHKQTKPHPMVQQDMALERINSLQERLNELKILKLKYELYELQRLRSHNQAFRHNKPA